ncbi:MAG: type II secretion system protein GspN, partial [Myxococcota bacterium]|nr:type II secretion system protein GspN [Myxococcota bacterium]
EGELSLSVEDFAVQSGSYMGFQFEPTTFSEAQLAFEIEEGVAEVTEGRFVSDPVEAEVTGSITLNREPRRTRLDLSVLFKLSDTLDQLARISPSMRSARDDDGNYHFSVTGSLSYPRFREDRGAASPQASRPTTRSIGSSSRADDSEDMDARREDRLSRIRDRRQELLERRGGDMEMRERADFPQAVGGRSRGMSRPNPREFKDQDRIQREQMGGQYDEGMEEIGYVEEEEFPSEDDDYQAYDEDQGQDVPYDNMDDEGYEEEFEDDYDPQYPGE